MAVAAAPSALVRRLRCLSLTSADVAGLAAFYQRAFGFRQLAAGRRGGPEFERLMGVSAGAQCRVLALGRESIELLQFDRAGAPYPAGSAASDLVFQHFAIVVNDMTRAFERLSAIEGWTAISRQGPQHLPESSGGVTAYKFRDPEGHPLELLAFPAAATPPRWRGLPAGEPCLGIDHSAVSVADSARSIAFYAALGLQRSAHSLNSGAAQQRLDDVSEAQVQVTALTPPEPAPHLELLCYRAARRDAGTALCSNDIAATRLVFESESVARGAASAPRRLLDPDHHQLLIE
ncbi:MAG TPA: VOC family protein [Steroidobacteraceae bacterium]|jgi:catechol 2,3-dioxygenase-like lactoylglutathione lyase family enzyme|nr:VOC family protein [Steroidobacteraceae bacterium]